MNLDKNTITGWVLMALVMFGFIAYERYTAPTQEEIQQWQAQQDSIKAFTQLFLIYFFKNRCEVNNRNLYSECG